MNKIIKGSALAGFIVAIAVMGVVAANMNQPQPKGNSALANVDLDEHLETTDHIVIGLVKEVVKPYPDKDAHPDIPRYFGDVVVIVEEDLLNTVDGDEITIRTHHNSRQAPSFTEGERALLFLIPGHPDSVEGEGVYVVSGMYQGKYNLDEAKNKFIDPKYDDKEYHLSEIKAKLADVPITSFFFFCNMSLGSESCLRHVY